MAKKKVETESAIFSEEVAVSAKTPEEFLSEYKKENSGKTPSFGEWYSFRESFNKSNGLSDVTFKQWYSFHRYSIDQSKPFHPGWSVLGYKKEKSPMHDLSLESPEREYKRLLGEHLSDKEEAE